MLARAQASGLRQLLLDEEGPQVGELPCTGNSQNNELDECPADDAGVSGLGLVAELGFTLLYDCQCSFLPLFFSGQR